MLLLEFLVHSETIIGEKKKSCFDIVHVHAEVYVGVELKLHKLSFSASNLSSSPFNFLSNTRIYQWWSLTIFTVNINWEANLNRLVKKKYIQYTGCNRRNGPDFGRVFLMLNYTEKPQNTYIQSWTVWEIMAIQNCGIPSGPRTIAVRWNPYLLVGQQQAGVLRHHSTFQYDV